MRLISAHLGAGASLAAIRGGRCIDTTMGFTPLEGRVMATRSGSVDPGLLLELMREGYSADRLTTMLQKDSGRQALSGFRATCERSARPLAKDTMAPSDP